MATTYDVYLDEHNGQIPTWIDAAETLDDARDIVRQHVMARVEDERARVWATVNDEHYSHRRRHRRLLTDIIAEETTLLASWANEADPRDAMTGELHLDDCARDLEIAAIEAYCPTHGAGTYLIRSS